MFYRTTIVSEGSLDGFYPGDLIVVRRATPEDLKNKYQPIVYVGQAVEEAWSV